MPVRGIYDPQTSTPAMAQQAMAERRMAMADMIGQQQLAQGPSGLASILAAVIQPWAADRMYSRGAREYADAMSARAQQVAAAEEAKFARDQQRQEMTRDRAVKLREQAADRYGIKDPGARATFIETGKVPAWYGKPQAKSMEGGYVFDPSTGQATPIPGYAEQQARIAAAGRAPQGPSDLQQRIELAKSMGATPEQLRAMVVGASGGAANAQQQKQEQANALKGAQFETLQRNLARLDDAVKSIGGNTVFNGGPLDKFVLGPTEQGQELAQSSAQIMPILTALTRVPGVGSQSDLEARLNQLQLPSAEFSPEVNRRAMEGLRGYITDLQKALQTASATGVAAAPSAGSAGGGQDDPLGIR